MFSRNNSIGTRLTIFKILKNLLYNEVTLTQIGYRTLNDISKDYKHICEEKMYEMNVGMYR